MDTLQMESDVYSIHKIHIFPPSPCVPSFLDYCQTQNKELGLGTIVKTSGMTSQLEIQSNVVTNSSVTHLMDEHPECSRYISIIMELWMMEEDGE